MDLTHLLTATGPTAVGHALGVAQATLGAAHAAHAAAERRWRDALLGDDLAESVTARAALNAAIVEVGSGRRRWSNG